MKRVLITGGGGFVGANLARQLLHDGNEVHLLLRQGTPLWRIEEIQDHVASHSVNLTDQRSVSNVVALIRPEWIFHLAAHGAYSYQTDPRQMVQANLIGTINLVEACLRTGFDALVNTGSSSEYGFQNHAPAETERLEPNSHYAVTKAAATHYCRFTAQAAKMWIPTLRLYSVYGPYEEPTRLMPSLILRGLKGELPPLVDPAISRDYVYVEDACEAYLLAAMNPGSEYGALYNVGTGTQTSMGTLVEIARSHLPIAIEPTWGSMKERQWDTSNWVADNRKILTELQWRPRQDLEGGLRRMIAWFQDHPAMSDYYRQRQQEAHSRSRL